MQSQPIQIRWGIFQGDSLSALFFCTALIANIPGDSLSPLLFCTALIENIPGGLSFAINLLYSTYCEYSRGTHSRHYSSVQHLLRIFQGTLFRHYSSVQHLLRIFQGDTLSPLHFCTALIANIPGGLSFAINLLYSTYCEYSRGNLFRHYSSVQHLLPIFQGETLSPITFCTALIANIPGGHNFAIILYSTYCEYSRGTLSRHYSSVQHLLRIFQGTLFRYYSSVQHLLRIYEGDSITPLIFCTALTELTHELNRADCG